MPTNYGSFSWPGSSGGGSGSNASVGSNNTTAPGSSTEVGFIDAGGNLQPFSGTSAASGPNVAVTSAALPTGAATAAKQDTGNVSLASIDGKTPALGQALAAASVPVVLTAAQIATLTPLATVTANLGTTALISTANSSVATLGIGAVFTGTSEDISQYAEVRVYVFSDVASATDGLSLQQSSNGTNWDSTDVFTVPAATGKVFGVGVGAQFFRVVYTNGGTIQTSFRLQTIYHKTATKPSSQRPQDALSNDNDFEEVINVNMVYNGTSWDRLRGDLTNGAFVQVKSALPTGTNSIGSITGIAGTISLPTGAATAALQTALNAQIPTTLGQKTSAASLAVTLASDQSAVFIKGSVGTLTDGSGSTSATPSTSTQIFAANATRKYLLVQNLSTTATIWVNFTSAATAASGSYELAPLGSLVQETGFISTEVVNVLSTTASIPFTAKQG